MKNKYLFELKRDYHPKWFFCDIDDAHISIILSDLKKYNNWSIDWIKLLQYIWHHILYLNEIQSIYFQANRFNWICIYKNISLTVNQKN